MTATNASVDVTALMGDLQAEVTSDLDAELEIIDHGTAFPGSIYAEVPKWAQLRDVVAVMGDLRNSTGLNVDHHAKSSARIYEAATGGMVQALSAFDPAFMDIQGDGVFALFTGDGRYERGICSAITLRTFSEHTLVPLLQARLPKKPPETGLKVGMSAGDLLVKRIGVRGQNEPVWAGRPVNFAAKCAQAANAHELIITGKVFERLKSNEYLTWSCGCPDGVTRRRAWEPIRVATLPTDVGTQHKLRLRGWCDEHGTEFCAAILSGKTNRGLGYAA